MMFEKQCKSGTEMLATTSSNQDDLTTQSSGLTLPQNKLPEKDQEETGNGAAEGKGAVENLREIGRKEKMANPDQSNDEEAKAIINGSQSPARKRPRGEDTETSPVGLA